MVDWLERYVCLRECRRISRIPQDHLNHTGVSAGRQVSVSYLLLWGCFARTTSLISLFKDGGGQNLCSWFWVIHIPLFLLRSYGRVSTDFLFSPRHVFGNNKPNAAGCLPWKLVPYSACFLTSISRRQHALHQRHLAL